jgi:hypothetical protein
MKINIKRGNLLLLVSILALSAFFLSSLSISADIQTMPGIGGSAVALRITKHDGFEKWIDISLERVNSSRYLVKYSLNDSFKTDLQACLSLSGAARITCLTNLKNTYLPDVTLANITTSADSISAYPIVNLTSHIRADVSSLDVLNGEQFYVDFDTESGEKIKIGYGTIEITTVESAGDVGYYANVIYDSNGWTHVVHYDETHDEIRYCNNTNDHVWKCGAILSAGSTGYGVPMGFAVDSNNILHLSFYNNSDQKFYYCNNTQSPTTWTCEIAISASAGYPNLDMILDRNNKAYIVYLDSPDAYPHVCNNTAGTWFCSGVITSTFCIYSQFSGIDSNGIVHLMLWSREKDIYCNSTGTWKCQVARTGGDDRGVLSAWMDSNGYTHSVRATFCGSGEPSFCTIYYQNNANNYIWSSPVTLASGMGRYLALTGDNNNFLHLVYYNNGAGKLMYMNNTNNYVWTSATISDNVGITVYNQIIFQHGIAIRKGSISSTSFHQNITVAYRNYTDQDLEVAVMKDYGAAAPYLTAIFNYASVNYGSLSANTHDNPAPNQAIGIYNVTVDTNANYKVSASGTDFSGSGYAFGIGNLKMDTNSTKTNLANTTAVTLSTSLQQIDAYLPTDTINYHGFWLSIPAGQYAAAYSSTVTVNYATI